MRKSNLSMLYLVIACTLLTAFAHGEDWTKTFDLTGKPDFRVTAHDADVRIETWDQSKIEARVTTHGWHIGNGGLEIVDHQQGNNVELELREPHRAHFSLSVEARRTEVEIHMPRNAKMNAHTGDGNLLVKGLAGELEFVTGDGRLELEDLDGTLRAHTSDGSVHVSGRFDGLELRTNDGRVELEAKPGSQIHEAWDVRTSDGRVSLRVPADLAADLELHTSDGTITTNIPIVVEGSFSHHDLRGKMNGGGGRFTVHTSDGSVTLDKY